MIIPDFNVFLLVHATNDAGGSFELYLESWKAVTPGRLAEVLEEVAQDIRQDEEITRDWLTFTVLGAPDE